MSEQKQTDTLTKQLIMPIILGVMMNTIMDYIKVLDPLYKTLIIVILGLAYSGLYLSKNKKMKFTIPKKTVNLMTIALIIAIILTIIAAYILFIDLIVVLFQIIWLVLMIITIHYSRSLPTASIIPKSTLSAIAAVSLGASVTMGATPIIGYTIANPELTITNNCDLTINFTSYGITIAPQESRTIEVTPITIKINHMGDKIIINAAYDEKVDINLHKSLNLTFNEEFITKGDQLVVNLMDRQNHELIVNC